MLAYISPGTGSLFLQVVLIGAAGALVAIRSYWNNLVNFFKDLFKKRTP